MRKYLNIIVAGVILVVFCRCGGTHEHEETGHGVFHTIKQHENDSTNITIKSTDYLKESKLIKVLLEDSTIAGDEFFIEERGRNLTMSPCSNCHNQPLKEMQANRPDSLRKSHWNVKLAHASMKTMECTTCHDPNNVEQLTSVTKKPISLDHSYQLCGQCHSTQYKDWQASTHGKRRGGWTAPRVVTSCVGCHNPHKPAFEHRFPARFNTMQGINKK